MPLSAILTLAPTEPTTAPAILGRAVHAWLLRRVADVDAALAQRLHQGEGSRPFTVSNLRGAGRPREGKVSLDPDHACWLRVTSLTDEMSDALQRALPEPGELLILAGASFAVREVTTDPTQHPWAGQATYGELVQGHTLRTGPHPRAVVLRFSSPTLFRSGGKDLPLPQPMHVFGSYLRKWNAFSPLTLPEEALRYAEECVALGRFRIRSHLVSFEGAGKGAHVGFTGEVRYRFLVGDPYSTRLMRLLAGYAFWCGTGYRTSVGLGQTRLLGEGCPGAGQTGPAQIQ